MDRSGTGAGLFRNAARAVSIRGHRSFGLEVINGNETVIYGKIIKKYDFLSGLSLFAVAVCPGDIL
jgi:hypothetical protein